jgi:hypothetical protein
LLAGAEQLQRRRHEVWAALKDQAKALWGAVSQKAIFLPALFTLCWQVRLSQRGFLDHFSGFQNQFFPSHS